VQKVQAESFMHFISCLQTMHIECELLGLCKNASLNQQTRTKAFESHQQNAKNYNQMTKHTIVKMCYMPFFPKKCHAFIITLMNQTQKTGPLVVRSCFINGKHVYICSIN